MKRSFKCLKGLFYIQGIQMGGGGGGSLNMEILRGGGLKQFWKSRWEWGSKNRAFRHGGVDFSGITQFCNMARLL